MEYIKGLPIKEWGGTILASVIALVGVVYVQVGKDRAARMARAMETDKATRAEAERKVSGDRTFDIAQTQDLTARFKALMDGYEARIIDLTNELRATKVELREARAEIAQLREQLNAAG